MRVCEGQQMDLDRVAAYLASVPPDRTIRLPDDLPVGATIAVVLLPPTSALDAGSRRKRFARTRATLRAAAERAASRPEVDDATLDALIDRVRHA